MSSIYFHIPYCKQACHYCNFHFSVNRKNEGDLFEAMQAEMELRKDEWQNKEISSIYFGGGSPSLWPVDSFKKLIELLRVNALVEHGIEITLEANPDDITLEYAIGLKEAGINRLSIGIQSFDDKDLQWMNRAHNSEQSLQSIQRVKEAGFKEISIDLIYGIPNSTSWQKNLELFRELDIDHLSAYMLTVEPKTKLAHEVKKRNVIVSDLKGSEEFIALMDWAEKNDYKHYEISNFCRNEKYAKHNSAYWKNLAYLGIGPGAHSFDGEEKRSWNVSNNKLYIEQFKNDGFSQRYELLSQKDRLNELIMISLRQSRGLNLSELKEQFGHRAYQHVANELTLINEDYYHKVEEIITLSKTGKCLADAVISQLFVID